MQRDHLISTRRPNLIVDTKKLGLAVPAKYRVKLKETKREIRT